MEVVAGDLPFQRRNVVEWSHRDRLTGALELARRETNHWSASTASATHNYGKVVDHRALNLGDGRVQQTQRKQLEVFSTQVPGGSLQVIRSSTTSSSRSSVQFTQSGMTGTSWSSVPGVDTAFGDLQLALHPLDLSSEKTKASVGRSIGWRRPPSRVARTHGGAASVASASQESATKSDAQEKRVEITVEDEKADNDDNNGPIISFPSDDDSSERTTSITSASSRVRHSITESRKSCSSENLVKVGVDGDGLSSDGGSVNGFLGRTSVLRRSLQYTRPPDFPTGTSVRRIREEIEARGVGGVVTAIPVTLAGQQPVPPKEQTLDKVKRIVSDSIATQNHSFVTVKSLNEVRGRLRSKAGVDKPVNGEESADSAVEDTLPRRTRVQSYVFGMDQAAEAPADKPAEKLAAPNGLRTEEWYRRRKSYGFEPDLPPQNQDLISLKESKEDSWSDSGGLPAFSVSPLLKHLDAIKRSKTVANQHARPASLYEPAKKTEMSLFLTDARTEVNGLQKTVVCLGDDPDMARRRDALRRRAERDVPRQGQGHQGRHGRSLTDPVSVSIPVVANDSFTVKTGDGEARPAEPALLINGFHYDDAPSAEAAVVIVEDVADDEKVVRDKLGLSEQLLDSAEDATHSRGKKKVEFSKTEVHFAAEPGRFNLVATDDKPPPTSIVRGRRRQKLLAEQRINKSGLPEVRFGDSPFEQNILSQDGGRTDGEEEHKATTGAVITVTMEGKLSPDHPNERLQPLSTKGRVDDEKPRGVVRCTSAADGEITSTTAVPMWRSTVTLKSNSFASPSVTVNSERQSDGEAEFQRLLKSLRPTGKRDLTTADSASEFTVTTPGSPIVRPKGFSTTVNVGPPQTNGIDRDPVGFVSQHSINLGSSAQKTTLHSLKLSRLGLESTPLVLLANSRPRRPRASRRSPMPSEDEDLSDDSLQADAEVRAYMVDKSSIAHLGVSPPVQIQYTPSPEPPSPSLYPADVAGPDDARARRYRHHASKAERLVQVDAKVLEPQPRAASPNSVYIVPEQRMGGFPALPRSEFRPPSPALMPKSFSLVDSVNKKAEASPQVQKETADFERERSVSVREILNRLSADKSEARKERERIIEVVSVETKVAGEDIPNDAHCRKVDPEPERVNGVPITDSVIFRDYRPMSPGDLNLTRTSRRADRSHPQTAAHSCKEDAVVASSPVRALGRVLAPPNDAKADDREAEARPEEDRVRRLRRSSPLVAQAEAAEGREFLHSRAQPGGHHIDVVEKFLRSERSHHHERPVPVRDRSADARRHRAQEGDDADRKSFHHRSHSREDTAERLREIERRSRSKEPQVDTAYSSFELHDGRKHRSRSRDEFRVRKDRSRTKRRSRSRDELEGDRSRETRSRSRSQDELEVDRGHGRRSRSRDELERRYRERGHDDARHRSRSRDVFDISNQLRQRSRSPEKRESGRTSRSREELDRRDHGGEVNGDVKAGEDGGKDRRIRAALEKSEAKPSDWKRPEASYPSGKERQPEAAERRHRCKCADRGGESKIRPADRASRTQANEKVCHRSHGAGGGGGDGSRKAKVAADRCEKGDKLVRKTRTHVAAISSPIAHLVKPSRDRRLNDSKRAGDVHLVMEPIRPVRRIAPAKNPSSVVATPNAKGGAKAVLAQKRSVGTVSNSNSSLSEGKAAVSNQSCTEALRERPTRRNYTKSAYDS